MRDKQPRSIQLGTIATLLCFFSFASYAQSPQSDLPAVPLQTAVTSGNLTAVKQHIAAGSNLDEPDAFTQSTPLMNAILFGKTEIAKLLIEAGADLEKRGNDGSTAILTATFFAHLELVRILIDHGADLHARNSAGANAIMLTEIPWPQIKPVYDMVSSMLTPAGLVLDYKRIQSTRPKIAKLLRNLDTAHADQPPRQNKETAPDFVVEKRIPTGDEKYLKNRSDYIFDQSKIATFELRIPGSSLSQLDADPSAEKYVEGSLTFEGETISPVGIRYKGSVGAWAGGLSGFNPMDPSGHKIRTKLSMKVKFNGYGAGKRFYGLNKLQFHSQNLDPSQMHERLGYWLFREMGVPAPRSVHARLVINGKFSGLYALTEQIDGRFGRYHFEDGDGNLYKEIWPINADGQAQDEAIYLAALKTNEEKNATATIFRNFAQEIAAASEQDLPKVISRWMNVREIVAYAVVDRAIRNDDGAFHWYCMGDQCSNHNFYWYEEPKSRRVHLIPWDLDNAFDNIIRDTNPVTPIADAWGNVRNNCQPFNYGPFNLPQRSAACDKLISGWASFEDEYDTLRTQLIEGPLSEDRINTQLDRWTNQIREATIEASRTHSDAISLDTWEFALNQLKAQLNHVRTH